MSEFKLQEQLTVDVGDCVGGDEGEEHYVATVASTVQFYSCIKMIASGLSFRQASKVMQLRNEGDTWSFCTCFDDTANSEQPCSRCACCKLLDYLCNA